MRRQTEYLTQETDKGEKKKKTKTFHDPVCLEKGKINKKNKENKR